MNDFWGSRAVKGKSWLWWRDGHRRRGTKSRGAYKGSSRHPSLGDGSQMSDPAGPLQLIWKERLLAFLFNHFGFHPQGTMRSECVLGFISPTYHLQSTSFHPRNDMGQGSKYSPSTDARVLMCGPTGVVILSHHQLIYRTLFPRCVRHKPKANPYLYIC